MNKKVIAGIIIILVVVLVYYLYNQEILFAPEEKTPRDICIESLENPKSFLERIGLELQERPIVRTCSGKINCEWEVVMEEVENSIQSYKKIPLTSLYVDMEAIEKLLKLYKELPSSLLEEENQEILLKLLKDDLPGLPFFLRGSLKKILKSILILVAEEDCALYGPNYICDPDKVCVKKPCKTDKNCDGSKNYCKDNAIVKNVCENNFCEVKIIENCGEKICKNAECVSPKPTSSQPTSALPPPGEEPGEEPLRDEKEIA